jgi:hypothetical protein
LPHMQVDMPQITWVGRLVHVWTMFGFTQLFAPWIRQSLVKFLRPARNTVSTSACPLGVRPNGITINTNSAPVTIVPHEMLVVFFHLGVMIFLDVCFKATVAIFKLC